YAIGDLAWLGLDPYFQAPGAGVRFLSFAAANSVLDARIETRDRQFTDPPDPPQSDLRTGWQTPVATTYSYYRTPSVVITTQAYAQREAAKADFFADTEIAVSGGFAWTFNNPLWQAQYPWTFQWGAGLLRRDYDEPDPTINVNE